MVKDMLIKKGAIKSLRKNWQGSFFQRHPELKSKFILLSIKNVPGHKIQTFFNAILTCFRYSRIYTISTLEIYII
jgi:hypothetical protein